MKDITDYINEGLFGFGSTKQIDVIKHICSSVQGLSYCVNTYIKKQIPDYYIIVNNEVCIHLFHHSSLI